MSYFERLKDRESEEEKALKVEKPMIERLSFKGKELFLDDRCIFVSPISSISKAILSDYERMYNGDTKPHHYGSVYIGTADCCHGHVYTFHHGGAEEIHLRDMMSVSTNVYGIMPAAAKNSHMNKDCINSFLVSGCGCHGEGVRLYHESPSGEYEDILWGDRWREVAGDRKVPKSLVIRDDSIFLLLEDEHCYRRSIKLDEFLTDHINLEPTVCMAKQFQEVRVR